MKSAYSSLNISAPVALFLDWDDTLVNTSSSIHKAVQHTLFEFNVAPLRPSIYQQSQHPGFFQKIFGEKASSALCFFETQALPKFINRVRPLPGSKALLQFLVHHEITASVVSNKAGPVLRQEISYLGWGHFFKNALGSGDTPQRKPSPIPLITALKKAGLSAGRHVWFAGDHINDILCAEQANCTPVSIGETAYPQALKARDCIELHKILRTCVLKNTTQTAKKMVV